MSAKCIVSCTKNCRISMRDGLTVVLEATLFVFLCAIKYGCAENIFFLDILECVA